MCPLQRQPLAWGSDSVLFACCLFPMLTNFWATVSSGTHGSQLYAAVSTYIALPASAVSQLSPPKQTTDRNATFTPRPLLLIVYRSTVSLSLTNSTPLLRWFHDLSWDDWKVDKLRLLTLVQLTGNTLCCFIQNKRPPYRSQCRSRPSMLGLQRYFC